MVEIETENSHNWPIFLFMIKSKRVFLNNFKTKLFSVLGQFTHTVNDLINARGVYLMLGVLGGALNRYEAFIRERRIFHFNVNETK